MVRENVLDVGDIRRLREERALKRVTWRSMTLTKMWIAALWLACLRRQAKTKSKGVVNGRRHCEE